MKTMKYLLTSILLLSMAVAANAMSNLSGSYYCKGYDPYSNLRYGGPITIKKQDNTYTVVWNLGQDQVYTGTGIYNGDTHTLSVLFYNNTSVKSAGLTVYQVMSDGVLKGQWVMNDEDKIGTETCVRQ